MKLVGVDLAWQTARNTSAAAVGRLHDSRLTIDDLYEDLDGIAAVLNFVVTRSAADGVAVDAPGIINNVTGQRACEKALGRAYGARKACCHPSNLTLYPDAPSVQFASALARRGYTHLGRPDDARWQIECYPHPALIELFGLAQRLQYKKGSVAEKRAGQVRLAGLIRALNTSPVLGLSIDAGLCDYLDASAIHARRGAAVKRNEDALDAIVCTYIAGLYATGATGTVYGGVDDGYIYVPQVRCVD